MERMKRIRRLLGKRKAPEDRKPLRKVCIHRIRMRQCKTGTLLEIISFVLAVLSIYEPRIFPLFMFFIVDYVVSIVPAFFIEDLEIES